MAQHEILLRLGQEQIEGLRSFDNARGVLEHEREKIVGAADTLGKLLNGDEQASTLVETASDMIGETDRDVAVEVHDLSPYIMRAVGPFSTPEQTVGDQPANVRHTMDWQALGNKIREAVKDHPEREEEMVAWYLDAGADMVKTTYAIGESTKPLIDIKGAANDQSRYRSILGLLSMSDPEWSKEKGLTMTESFSLNGEDGVEQGWMKLGSMHGEPLVSAMRTHVAERIKNGEIQPNIIVTAVARELKPGKEGKPGELGVAKRHLDSVGMVDPIYASHGLGITEADNFLAGSVKVFGGDLSTLVIQDVPPQTEGDVPTKLLTYESALGPISMVVTSQEDSRADVGGLLKAIHELRPDLFKDRDGIFGTTTAIYTLHQRVMYRAAALELGLKGVSVDMFGLSAHAAGINRLLPALVSETNTYLKVAHELSGVVIEQGNRFAGFGVKAIGARALHGSGELGLEQADAEDEDDSWKELQRQLGDPDLWTDKDDRSWPGEDV